VPPYANDEYYKLRKVLGIPAKDVLKLNDEVGLHPSLKNFKKMHDEGSLAVVLGTGYPGFNLSHFRGREVWEAGKKGVQTGKPGATGWLGRFVDYSCKDSSPTRNIAVGPGGLPLGLTGVQHPGIGFVNPDSFRFNGSRNEREKLLYSKLNRMQKGMKADPTMDLQFVTQTAVNANPASGKLGELASEYKTKIEYPDTQFGNSVKTIAAFINGGLDARAFYAAQGIAVFGGYDTHADQPRRLSQLLVELDGFDTTEGVILVAATNRPDVLDPALLRPGRFDRQVVVNRPDVRGRIEILKVHTKKVPIDTDVNLEQIARGTPGFSGADLENLVNEAALWAARLNKKVVELIDFENAKDKVMMGAERKSMVLSEEEKRTTAYHEAGHALMAKLLPGTDPVHKVTIIPRGRAMGMTMQLPIDDRHSYSQEFLYNTLSILLGGRVAEELVLKDVTTGAGNDIERATELARKMVCEWGMSSKLGPITFGKKEEEIFLGREIAQRRDVSDQVALEIDHEVKRLIVESYERTKRMLTEHIHTLRALAEALLEKEVLDSLEIDQIINSGSVVQEPAQVSG